MRLWLVASVILVLPMAGCRLQQLRQANYALEEENRLLEDRLYQLADILRDCKRENERLRARLAGISDFGTFEKDETEAPSALPELQSPTVEGVPGLDTTFEDRASGATGDNASVAGRYTSDSSPGESGEVLQATSLHSLEGNWAALESAERIRPTEGSTEVVAVTLDAQFLGGFDDDHDGTDDGIVLLLQPRDRSGRIVAASGDVSVVVLDPGLAGQEARLARWDLPKNEVATRLRKLSHTQGIYLKLRWPGKYPVHERLHVFVRFVTDDGRRVETDREFTVRPIGARSVSTADAAIRPQAADSPPAVRRKMSAAVSSGTNVPDREASIARRAAPAWTPYR